MRASIANADYGVRERPLAFFSGNNELGQMNKRPHRKEFPCGLST